jgi:RNA polymerase primary sigma factor
MHQPSAEEISNYLGISREEVVLITSMTNGTIPLEINSADDEYTSIVDIHEDYTYNPERTLMKKTMRAETLRFLNCLKDREKRILIYRYQLNGCKRYTLKTIGDKMGISSETVRQIEIKALKKIRENSRDFRDTVYYDEAM